MATAARDGDLAVSEEQGGSRGKIRKSTTYFVEQSNLAQRVPTDQVEVLDDDLKKRVGKRNLMATGCTNCEADGKTYTFKPLVGTTTEDLGEYGVGVQLYFEFLYFVGILFAVMFFLSLPAIAMSLMGTRMWNSPTAQDWGFFYQSLGSFSIANLGYCDHDSCNTADKLHKRPLLKDSDVLLRDVTGTLAMIDGIGTSLFLLFGLWFHFYWIPRTKAKQDDQCITPADYSIHVEHLPKMLDDPDRHGKYEQLLEAHFKHLLGDDDQEAVQEVACIREYDGAIRTYMDLGELMKSRRNAIAKRRRANDENDTKAAESAEKEAKGIHDRIASMEASLQKGHGPLTDKEREVCAAYVMFNREDQKAKVLEMYRHSHNFCGRLRQKSELRFQGRRIIVSQACEPNDLYWENLDFHPRKHWGRRLTVRLFALLLLLFAIQLMVLLKSKGNGLDTSLKPAGAWVLRRPHGLNGPRAGACLRVCDWKAYESLKCSGSPWQNGSTFEARDVQSNTMLSSSQCWESPLCSNSSFGTSRDWVGVRLASPATMRCTQFDQLGPDPSEQLELFTCDAGSLPSSSNASMDWDPEKHCYRMASLPLSHPSVSAGTRVPSGQQLMRLDGDCLVSPSLEAAQLAKDAGAKPNDIRISCFCLHQVKKHGISFRLNRATSPEQKVCYDWSNEENVKQLRFAGGILAVLVFNQVQLLIFAYLDSWTRYRTATELASSQLYNLFGAQLINTGIVVVLVGMNLQRSMRNVPVLGGHLGEGSYDDVGLKWFLEIGTGLFTAILGQMGSAIVVPVLFALALDPLYRWWFSRGLFTAETVCALYTFTEWGFSLRLAETMTVIFCVMMYSGIMPLLYVLGAVYCATAYWVDKWVLLRKSRKPPAYTETIISWAAQLLPLAALAHISASMWMYGNQELFPSNWSWLRWFVFGLVGMTKEKYAEVMEVYHQASSDVRPGLFSTYFQARMADGGRNACLMGIFLLFVLAVVLVVHLLWDYLPVSVAPWFKGILGKMPGMRALQAGLTDVSFAQAKENASQARQLFSYHLSANPCYREAHIALTHDPQDEENPNSTSSFAGVLDKADRAVDAVGNFLSQGEDKVLDGVEGLVDKVAHSFHSAVRFFAYKKSSSTTDSDARPTGSQTVGVDMPVPEERNKHPNDWQDSERWSIDQEETPVVPPTIDARPAVVPTSSGMTTGSCFLSRTHDE